MSGTVGHKPPVDDGSQYSRKQSHADPYALLMTGPTIPEFCSYAVASPAHV